ncbi:MAG: DUF4298 domain-containing protein [Spirochaetaceae bacterium]|nr:DUF4298 domain-containing protein [Spirochaetaceae bacterium]
MGNNLGTTMIDRISKNEERLDHILLSLRNLEKALSDFKSQKNNLRLLNNYYSSKNWLKDKDAYEEGRIQSIKAGVLSEDAVWNLNEDIADLLKEMKTIAEDISFSQGV